MTCKDIAQLIKRFQDDLLLEEEYQAFVAHVNRCAPCQEYVWSIGSLSNQLWALAKISVPEDLASSVIFKLRHPPSPAARQWRLPRLEEIFREGLLVIFMVVVMVGVYHLFIKGFGAQAPDPGEPAISEESEEGPSPGDDPSTFFPDETASSEEARENFSPAPGVVEVYTNNVVYSSPEERKAASLQESAKPLHWHILLSAENAAQEARQRVMGLAADEQRKKMELKQLEQEIKRVPREAPESFRQHYSLPATTVTPGVSQKPSDLDIKLGRKAQLEKDIQRLGRDKEAAGRLWQEELLKKEHEGLENKTQLLDTLRDLGIRLDYDRHNMLIFLAPGDKVDQVLEQILIFDDERSSFLDLSKARDTISRGSYRVYLYLGQEESPGVHWDIEHVPAGKKDKILAAVQELSSAGNYTSEDCLIFYASLDKIKELRLRIQAMRVTLAESGSLQGEEKAWESKPLAVSICFLD